jgi:hypothetical protein
MGMKLLGGAYLGKAWQDRCDDQIYVKRPPLSQGVVALEASTPVLALCIDSFIPCRLFIHPKRPTYILAQNSQAKKTPVSSTTPLSCIVISKDGFRLRSLTFPYLPNQSMNSSFQDYKILLVSSPCKSSRRPSFLVLLFVNVSSPILALEALSGNEKRAYPANKREPAK